MNWRRDGHEISTDRERFDLDVIWGFVRLDDVFVLEPHRGRGLRAWLVETVVSHPDLEGLWFLLDTDAAHGLYERFGFRPVDATRLMVGALT